MFPFYREDLIRFQAAERERTERHNHGVRQLRAGDRASDRGLSRRLAGAIAELRGAPLPDRSRQKAPPCPEPRKAMS